MRLYIDSGTHVDTNLTERISRIEKRLSEPDLIFFEGDSSAFTREAYFSILRIFLYTPLLALAVTIQIYIFIELGGRVFSVIGGESAGRDEEVVRTLKDKYNIESREVDLALTQYIFEKWIPWSIVNWGILVVIFVVFWPLPPTLPNIYHFMLYSAIAGYLLFLPLLAVTLHARNHHFARTISESKDEAADACLVTGEAHHAAVANILANESDISVLNPEPEDVSIVTVIVLSLFDIIINIRSKLSNG